jgi:molybdenum cofactor cytidylyltransferase
MHKIGNKIGIIILAAGDSSRLGRPKQLLPYRGKTLLSHIIMEASGAGLDPVIVVTGAFESEVSESLRGMTVEIVYNPRWSEGMASGIVAGLSKLIALGRDADAGGGEPGGIEPGAAIIAVCDQPYISASLFRKLVEMYNGSAKGLIACHYSDAVGTPVLFGRGYFTELLALSGKEGAKNLLKNHPDELITISFPRGDIDIDTDDDYARISGFN